jgi:hypothetical protein
MTFIKIESILNSYIIILFISYIISSSFIRTSLIAHRLDHDYDDLHANEPVINKSYY